MLESPKNWGEMLLGTSTAAPNFHFKLPENTQKWPPAETGGVGEIFFSPKTLPVTIKYTIQMEKPEISRSLA